jgi:hypothetical protein
MAVTALCITLAGTGRLSAQTSPVVARAASVTGVALVSTGTSGSSMALSAGFLLNPGDRVDTRSGGRVVIDLSDGSMVVVEPQSVVQLKNFRAAESLRELFEILLGTVRVKINHFGGRPNPYRMNSPTASIAVRGTEFTVAVSPGGDTEVTVYEGAVQVTSLSDPSQTVLVESGRGVLIQAGRDFHMLGAAGNPLAGRPGWDDSQHGDAQENPASGAPTNTIPAAKNSGGWNAGSQSHGEDAGATPRATASAYDSYVAGLSDIAQVPFLFRFNAFPESHLDSLENPAYATQFTAAEARVFVLPTFGGGPTLDENRQTYGPAGAQSSDYSITPQISIFSPIGNSGFFAGGSISGTRTGNNAVTSTPDEDSVSAGQGASSSPTRGTSASNFYSGSLVVARRMGSATSLGLELESVRGDGSLSNTTTDTDANSVEQIVSASHISQTRLTAGFSRDLGAKTKLGVFYRYGFISATDHDLSHTMNGSAIGLNSTDSAGHSSEIGFRLRGVITPTLSYGLTGAWSGVSLGDGLVRTNTVNSHEHDRAQLGSAALGLGYALNRRTVVTFDAAAGTSRVAAQRIEDATGNTLQNSTANGHFLSAHVAIQSDLSRRLFVSASFLNVWHSQRLNIDLFPDQTGGTTNVQDSFFPTTPSAYQLASHFSDFGIGWRFSPHLFVQYLFTTDYGVTAPSHALMLRYTFKLHKGE